MFPPMPRTRLPVSRRLPIAARPQPFKALLHVLRVSDEPDVNRLPVAQNIAVEFHDAILLVERGVRRLELVKPVRTTAVVFPRHEVEVVRDFVRILELVEDG